MNSDVITAAEALERLKAGNALYLAAERNAGDISPAVREATCDLGQKPYAIIITCSDSRVIPEHIFSAGIGELFVIRVAGNVVDKHQLGSIEYAAEHLGCRLALVMGHDHCGAVDAAINHDPSSFIKYLTDEIKKAIGGETDEYRACRLNVLHSVRVIEESFGIKREEKSGFRVAGAIYRLFDGKVEFLE